MFYYPRTDSGALVTAELDIVIKRSKKYGLKLIVGPFVVGQKTAAWDVTLALYETLVAACANEPGIIGWWIVDEPQEPTLQPGDLQGIYDDFRALDPDRLIYINWNFADIKTIAGIEPHGGLQATDIYSTDFYPFTNYPTSISKGNLESYAIETIRALRTARMHGSLGHSWLQLFGTLTAYREPTFVELRNMAYLNFIFGHGHSYWSVKSLSRWS